MPDKESVPENVMPTGPVNQRPWSAGRLVAAVIATGGVWSIRIRGVVADVVPVALVAVHVCVTDAVSAEYVVARQLGVCEVIGAPSESLTFQLTVTALVYQSLLPSVP